ncbi:hypothetical protein X772_32235 [Mesorhizobium sp. LSJC280B00]|nr:hypothetical protein X772_32235 [Mesorhizobium sp. LSJC280B00]
MVLDVAATTGEINEGQMIIQRIDPTMKATGLSISTVTADAGCAYAKVYGAFESRTVEA